MANKEKKQEKKSSYSLPVRIMAIVLTVLLASGAAVSILAYLLESLAHSH